MHTEKTERLSLRQGLNGRIASGVRWIKNKKLVVIALGGIAVLVVALVVAFTTFAGGSSHTKSYKDVPGGAAGLDAAITYDCKTNCERKFDFNVYILSESGQQVAVVRPDSGGAVKLALSQGTYVMLIGKQVGKDKLFPQERIVLKNGKQLELKLRYKEGGSWGW